MIEIKIRGVLRGYQTNGSCRGAGCRDDIQSIKFTGGYSIWEQWASAVAVAERRELPYPRGVSIQPLTYIFEYVYT